MDQSDNRHERTAADRMDAISCLEQSLINSFLERMGLTQERLASLPPEQARVLRCRASTFASCRLAEIYFRAEVFRDLGA